MKNYLLLLVFMIIGVYNSSAGIYEEMDALEKDLALEADMKADKKSLEDMSTDELMTELKRDMTKKDKKSNQQRFHDILAEKAEKAANDDFEKLLADKILKSDESKSKQKKKSASQSKKSTKDTDQYHATVEQPADQNETKRQAKVKEDTKAKVKEDTKAKKDEKTLVDKAIATMEELRGADVNDRAAQKKGLDLLQQLIEADEIASKKRSATSIMDKIKIAKEDAEKRKTARFQAALKADTEMMKLLAAEKATKGSVKKTAEEIVDNKVVISKGTLMDDVLNLMAEDLVREITEKVSQKRIVKYTLDHGPCVDKRTDCRWLVDKCHTHRGKLEQICRRTCRYCVPSCKDTWSGKDGHRCKIIVKQGMCDVKNVEKYCQKSCGFCKIPSPPKCSKTQYGCCWDKQTAKADEDGTNCRPCKNQYKHICTNFKSDCLSTKGPGDFMRHHCPETCGVCSGVCRDRPKSAFYCPFWKKDLKWCETRRDLMKHFCPVTCNLC